MGEVHGLDDVADHALRAQKGSSWHGEYRKESHDGLDL